MMSSRQAVTCNHHDLERTGDGPRLVKCPTAFVASHKARNVTTARAEAGEAGWWTRGRRDYCPEHRKATP
ncbi:hypothetical protein QDA00_gp20 [Microbacterium phage Matzah]|uniref:Uncharacterized protein n=1 Tax=Microbacterium phage Matzah TaxID=2686228 RepID=A0A6B9L8Y7_9CAUD|nr:hypothetical protein QDA00_gp20 [Microbacterium phage Matzah]QHB37083.1 hypothetical protein SEA_MATZAH_90 [Microbacterium phage Matzah]